jgi:prepilin-type N-terminal cleavage/methylation domain-containing protein
MIAKSFTVVPARRARDAFTLVEMLISIVMLALLILLVTRVVNTAATVARPANKHIDTDTEARTVFDRMAVDFGKMLKRTDIDYWLKQQGPRYYPGHSFGHGQGRGRRPARTQQGSDQIAFFSQGQGSGYYPSSGSPSPLSLVGYRVNTTTYQLERMAKGLLWNAVSYPGGANTANYPKPIVFLPLTISTMWVSATDTSNDTNTPPAYETIGPNVFRFEYYYLLKNGALSDNPWYNSTNTSDPTKLNPPHTIANLFTDVEAIAVTIAVIDPASRSLLTTQNMIDLTDAMNDFQTQRGNGPVRTGVIEAQWNGVVTNAVTNGWIPPAAAAGIRIYNRYLDLKTL